MLVRRSWMIGKITAKMPNTHTHRSKQGTISENATRCPVGFAVICSDSLQKSKTLVVEGENFNSGLPQSRRGRRRRMLPYQFDSHCVLLGNCAISAARPTDISNANSRIQSCKYENSGCWGKNAFCLRSMDAEPRFNAYNCDVIVSNMYLVAPILDARPVGRKIRHIFFVLQISQTLVVLTKINVLTVVWPCFP